MIQRQRLSYFEVLLGMNGEGSIDLFIFITRCIIHTQKCLKYTCTVKDYNKMNTHLSTTQLLAIEQNLPLKSSCVKLSAAPCIPSEVTTILNFVSIIPCFKKYISMSMSVYRCACVCVCCFNIPVHIPKQTVV